MQQMSIILSEKSEVIFLNLFQWCLPQTSTTTWTKKNNVPCDDGDSCTKSDTCKQGQCNGTSFTCNSNCQSCNGRDCTLHAGYGYVAGKCTCKIAGLNQTNSLSRAMRPDLLYTAGNVLQTYGKQHNYNTRFSTNLNFIRPKVKTNH